MKRTRYLRPLVLCALALAVLVSAAPAQTTLTATPPNVSLSYNWYSEVAPSTTTSIVASVDNTVYTAVPADPWVTVLYGGTAGTLGGSGADTLTISIVPATVDALGLPPGSYSSSVALQISAVTVTTVGVTLTVPASPLSSSASPVALSYVTNGVANQAAATLISTIHDTNVAPDTYSVVAGFPNWLTVTPATGHASSGTPDSCTFTVVPANANGLSAGIHSYTVHPHPGELILISSDGLHGVIEPGVIADKLSGNGSLQAKCERLIDAAKQAGGPDNITVVLLQAK